MRLLPETFTKDGFKYQIVYKHDGYAIFRQEIKVGVYAYEAIKIKIYPERTLNNRILEAGEYYPSTAHWGQDAFTCASYDDAMNKIDYMKNKTTRLVGRAATALVVLYVILATFTLSACSKATDGISRGSTQTSLPPGRTIDTRCFDSNGLQVPCPVKPR